MNIHVPYTKLQPVTIQALAGYQVTLAKVEGPYGYRSYFRDRWRAGETFISVEHDVVPWPGALEQLWACPELWCVYGYHDNDNFADPAVTGFPYLGCVKFSAELIAATPRAWAHNPCDCHDQHPEDWVTLDRHIAHMLRPVWAPHQHFPKVRNANPVLA